MEFLITLLVLFFILLAAHFWLAGSEDLSRYDHPVEPEGGETIAAAGGPSESHRQAEAALLSVGPEIESLPPRKLIPWVRDFMDRIPEGRRFDAEFRPVECDGVRCEWVLAPGADPSRRVLYLHGGAFFAGSPLSHRTITARFSAVARAALLSVDYRLLPEHRRRDGIDDCRSAYRWLLVNGPDGPLPLSRFFIGGDSAGGNLALMLSAWARDGGLRSADAVVTFSPTTDSTFRAPSMQSNAESDAMVRSLMAPLKRVPRPMLRWMSALTNRVRPAAPEVSPVYGDLSGLPPTLIQASDSEMLYDDARRYVNKARCAGSPAYLQTWSGLLHAWPLFYPQVDEARHSWERVAAFLERVEAGEAGCYQRPRSR
ncbi:MAG: alpha/beta hydrolase [Xanthomonadales bacterium]|jgi:acetyl esterase/lipase|nr:alpha/beta hydrolase [Xanthomonadales bacterium]